MFSVNVYELYFAFIGLVIAFIGLISHVDYLDFCLDSYTEKGGCGVLQ